ncbi:hypothetical protein [Rhizobium sp. WYJ-E13]|uniref:hypothetical protein n=1 Tax=Rhizobium sp. WYJ-E13 TaxID=2849093 RepID=UPI001C1EDB2D|nr:hypothetical protein [Rhizobium sp. WYJ-E13]QWW71146.1 hypothetical protein KQ933_30735 [Rhizobium sp. WYJ-E13]
MMNVDILYLLDEEISVDPSCAEDIDGRQLETEMPHKLGFAGAFSSVADIRRGQRRPL